MTENYYDILGVSASASEEEIENAWREAVKEKHPDVSDNPDAGEEFKTIRQAYEVLGDNAERAKYDRLGHDAYVRAQSASVSGTQRSDSADSATSSTTSERAEQHQSSNESTDSGSSASESPWRHTRGSTSATHLWEDTPPGDPAASAYTTNKGWLHRLVGYVLVALIPAALSLTLLLGTGWAFIMYDMSVGVLILAGGLLSVVGVTVITISAVEVLLDTERRILGQIPG
jgi:hypothetical protein